MTLGRVRTAGVPGVGFVQLGSASSQALGRAGRQALARGPWQAGRGDVGWRNSLRAGCCGNMRLENRSLKAFSVPDDARRCSRADVEA